MLIHSQEMTDAFWARVAPLVPPGSGRDPEKIFARRSGGGRKPKPARVVFEAILHVLRTGCHWKALPAERFGSASTVHKRFLEWEKAGFFGLLWQAGLAEWAEMEGIAWAWRSGDAEEAKLLVAADQGSAETGGRGAGPAALAGSRAWCPVVPRRNRHASA